MSLSYRQRRDAGLIVRRRPARVPDSIRLIIRRQYLRREFRQLELALIYGISQTTVARIVAE
jgi:hypothetical protein